MSNQKIFSRFLFFSLCPFKKCFCWLCTFADSVKWKKNALKGNDHLTIFCHLIWFISSNVRRFHWQLLSCVCLQSIFNASHYSHNFNLLRCVKIYFQFCDGYQTFNVTSWWSVLFPFFKHHGWIEDYPFA
jgi:hypothetical protein